LDYQEAYGNGFEDMQRRVPDIALIAQLIGWEPHLSLENIVDDIAKALKR
jgi:UDP-glucose 4-epimerase